MNGRNGVAQLFEELDVECGASVECITDRVSVLRGVDIEVKMLGEREWAAIAPFVLVSGDRARILLRESDPRWYRLHAVIHQLSHLLCGHTHCAELPMSFEGLQTPAHASVVTGAVGGGGSVVEISRRRSGAQEVEAEALARRLAAYVVTPRPSTAMIAG